MTLILRIRVQGSLRKILVITLSLLLLKTVNYLISFEVLNYVFFSQLKMYTSG